MKKIFLGNIYLNAPFFRMHLRFEMLLLSYGKKWNTKELECLQKKLLDVSFDKVIKFGVLCLEEEKGKKM